MTSTARLHHIVFCVHRSNQDQAADLWRDLGYTFTEIDLADVGLRVLLDWSGGIEIISPTSVGPETAYVHDFLHTRGEGLYSVVLRTEDLDGAREVAQRHGASVAFEQDRSGEGYVLHEAMLTPVLGMPITLLSTDLPD